jgi:hypothetical protein
MYKSIQKIKTVAKPFVVFENSLPTVVKQVVFLTNGICPAYHPKTLEKSRIKFHFSEMSIFTT